MKLVAACRWAELTMGRVRVEPLYVRRAHAQQAQHRWKRYPPKQAAGNRQRGGLFWLIFRHDGEVVIYRYQVTAEMPLLGTFMFMSTFVTPLFQGSQAVLLPVHSSKRNAKQLYAAWPEPTRPYFSNTPGSVHWNSSQHVASGKFMQM